MVIKVLFKAHDSIMESNALNYEFDNCLLWCIFMHQWVSNSNKKGFRNSYLNIHGHVTTIHKKSFIMHIISIFFLVPNPVPKFITIVKKFQSHDKF